MGFIRFPGEFLFLPVNETHFHGNLANELWIPVAGMQFFKGISGYARKLLLPLQTWKPFSIPFVFVVQAPWEQE
jgi:hypothetical protein